MNRYLIIYKDKIAEKINADIIECESADKAEELFLRNCDSFDLYRFTLLAVVEDERKMYEN